jgi:hypothetical protein
MGMPAIRRETDMSGNNDVIKQLKSVVEKGGNLDVNTRDVLLFSAIIDIYDQLETLKPVLVFYKVGLYFASAMGLSVLGFIGALLTGKVEIVFK